jgi:phage terminase large subunit-like protein
MAEERFDFFNAVFLDTVLQPFHKKWFEFQQANQRTLVLGPRASWKCVASDSLIPTAEGLSYLHELLPSSDLPYTAEIQSNVNSCLGITEATQAFCNGREAGLEIETEDGFTLSCGPAHGIFVWDDHYLRFKKAERLRPGSQILFKCGWHSYANSDSNPYNVPRGLWFQFLSFFWAAGSSRWGIIWRQRTFRKKVATPLWKFFGHRDWSSLPPQVEEFLSTKTEGQFLPLFLRQCTKEAAKEIAKAFWWYNQHVKFTEEQAKEVQIWFLNLGLPLKRVGSTLLHRSPELRKQFYNFLKDNSQPLPYTENQIENLADLTLLELNNSAFTPPLIKLHAKIKGRNGFQNRTRKAQEFVSEYLQYAPNIRRFAFMFRFPFFLQTVKQVNKKEITTLDLATREGNYIANGLITHNSTILDKHYSIWRALRDPNIRIGIVSKSSLLSSSFVSQIKHVLESNQRIRMVWPDLINPAQAPKWNNNEVTLIRPLSSSEATFTAMGVGTTLAGRHFDILIFDDVVDTDCQASPILRKRIWDWFRFVAMQTLSVAQYTQAHIIGTLYHPEDLYHRVLDFEKDGKGNWLSSIQPAINPDGTSFWEEAFPLTELQSIEATYGVDVFKLQYQNDPEFGGTGLLDWSFFDDSYYDTDDVNTDKLDIVMGVDLAAPGTDKTSHHSSFAIVIVGTDSQSRKSYVIDAIKRKSLRMADQRDMIIDRYQIYPSMHSIQVEAYAVQTYFHEYLNEVEIPLPIYRVQTGGSKEGRYDFIVSLIQNGRLFFKENLHRELIEEICNFPQTSADLIDALYLALKGIQREPRLRFLTM